MPPEAAHLLHEATGERTPLRVRTTLGRSADNDVVLADAGCSNHHAIIQASPQGWVVEDLGSTNGTWVNGEWVQGRHALGEGDLLQLGTLRFKALGLAALPAAPPASRPGPTVILPPPAKVVPPQAPTPASPAKKPVALIAGGILLGLGALAVAAVSLWPRKPGSQAGAPTLTAASQEAKGKPPLPPKLDLLREATRFRAAACGAGLPDAVGTWGGEGGLRILEESPVFEKAPALWSYFFCGAVMLGGHLESPKPVVAYYNPYLDGALLTQWEMKDGQARILTADLRIGSRMAGQASRNPKLAWWVAELPHKPLPAALKDQYAAFLVAFARDFPTDSASVPALGPSADAAETRTFLERQAVSAFGNLAAFQDPKGPAYLRELTALRQALRSGDAPLLGRMLPAGNPMKPAALASQPGWVRREAVPIYALAGARQAFVLLAPTAAPRFCLLTAWAPGSKLEYAVPYDLDGGLTPVPKQAPAPGGRP